MKRKQRHDAPSIRISPLVTYAGWRESVGCAMTSVHSWFTSPILPYNMAAQHDLACCRLYCTSQYTGRAPRRTPSPCAQETHVPPGGAFHTSCWPDTKYPVRFLNVEPVAVMRRAFNKYLEQRARHPLHVPHAILFIVVEETTHFT